MEISLVYVWHLRMYNMRLKPGKAETQTMQNLLQDQVGAYRTEVQTGPAYGVDVSLIDIGQGMGMALCSDPLSLLPELGMQESAWLSLQLMVNDMATTGFAPMYGQFVLNLPAEMSEEDLNRYWHHIHTYSKAIGLSITGGHTGFIPGMQSSIAGGGTLITLAPMEQIRISSKARAGEALLISKSAAISSAGILALRFPNYVRQHIGKAMQEKAAEMFYQISVLEDARTALGDPRTFSVTAMHDVTEGGILGGIYEFAKASGNGVRIQAEAIPIEPAQAAVCKLFDLDPLHCIGAGAMLFTCPEPEVAQILHRMQVAGIPCKQIGSLCDPDQGIRVFHQDQALDWQAPGTDPYWAAYFKASAQGLN